jgi:hypothetical protein
MRPKDKILVESLLKKFGKLDHRAGASCPSNRAYAKDLFTNPNIADLTKLIETTTENRARYNLLLDLANVYNYEADRYYTVEELLCLADTE